MPSDVNRCMMRFRDRAERIERKQIIDTFVEVGPLFNLLESPNNQLVYGRRGVGKTHALLYLADRRVAEGDHVIYVDCRNLGSNISVYADPNLARSERATRMLVDVCTRIHEGLLENVTDPGKDFDYSRSVPVLDELIEALNSFKIIGTTETNEATKFGASADNTAAFGMNGTKPTAQFDQRLSASEELHSHEKNEGSRIEWIDFGNLAKVFQDLYSALDKKRIWILVDEWSAIPLDLQPFLADLLRRTIFPCAGYTVKIGAIEHRSKFINRATNTDYIGLELGSDITPAIDLDDYLVFDRNSEKALEFFKGLMAKHLKSVAEELAVEVPQDTEELVAAAVTQENVFREFVIATEGVPRDALHILQRAATKADNDLISLPTLKEAVLAYYQTDKYNSINENPRLRELLEWIRDRVKGDRRTRAFLIPVGEEDELIDELFDRRALHILNRSMSAAHRPGDRFIVYKLDYGCYIDLRATDKFPEGLLFANDNENIELANVPEDDARSYRRAILDLEEFRKSLAAESNEPDNKPGQK